MSIAMKQVDEELLVVVILENLYLSQCAVKLIIKSIHDENTDVFMIDSSNNTVF